MLFTHGECSPFSGLLDNNRRAKVRFSAYMAPPTLNFFSLFAYCASQLQGEGGNSSTESVFPKGFTRRQGRGICTQAIPRSALPYQTERTAPYRRQNYSIQEEKPLHTVGKTTLYSSANYSIQEEKLPCTAGELSPPAVFPIMQGALCPPHGGARKSGNKGRHFLRTRVFIYKEWFPVLQRSANY